MADMTPPPGATAFLARHGWVEPAITPLAGDASFRRYFRVADGDRRAVLMDAPPQQEDSRPFLSVAGWLRERGFAAPAVHGHDLDAGFVLLEDLGDARLREHADAHGGVAEYRAAVDLLVRLRQHPAGPFAPYDRATLQREAALFVDWYCPAVGLEVDRDGYARAWDAVLNQAITSEPVTVLRDYHAENLMLVGPERALALLDFQDALAGHPAYDLVSLLQDARRDVDPNLEELLLGRYQAATGEGDDFLAAYHLLGAQRNAKILGIFARLWKRDGKDRYTAMCPRVWAYLERDLSEPVLEPVAAWFDEQVPPERRGDPRLLGA